MQKARVRCSSHLFLLRILEVEVVAVEHGSNKVKKLHVRKIASYTSSISLR